VKLTASIRRMPVAGVKPKKEGSWLLDAPALGELDQDEDYESDDDEGYQRHQEVSDEKALTEDGDLEGCQVFHSRKHESDYWHYQIFD
jgi:hypothetical protein